MSFPMKASKRPHDRSPLESNGKRKWQKSAGFSSQHPPLKISPGSTIFRILCPISKSGSVIGKGGSVINNIRQETGVKVRVEDPLTGDDERVIVIMGPEKEVEVNNEKSKEDGKDDNTPDQSEKAKEDEDKSEDKLSSPVLDPQSEKGVPAVQKALFLVFERIVQGETESEGRDEESNKSASIFVRLLVLSSQVGCVLGKGGKNIKQMAAESGAQIRIVPKDKHPQCASASDELVQITGGLAAVRKGLQLVSQRLLNNSLHERDTLPISKSVESSSQPFATISMPEAQPPNFQFPAQSSLYSSGPRGRADYQLGGSLSTPKYHETFIPSRARPPGEIIFRLLCHDDKVGGVIGKGGTIIKTIHHETGCDIRILDGVPGSEDRIIVISGRAHPEDSVSSVQNAVLRVQGRIVRGTPEINEKTVTSRILVASNQIGCLLGKGGSIITEMRKFSGASIFIVPKDQIPRCASENDDVVQVTGAFDSVQEALLQITSRLQQHLFRDTFPSVNHPPHHAFQDQVPPFPYMGRREPSPPGMYPGGLPGHGRIHPQDDQSVFVHNIQRHNNPHSSGRNFSSAPWELQGIANVGGPMGMPEYTEGVPQRRHGGFGGGSQPAMVTSTNVEVIVPRAIVPSIYGEDGSSLKQIRQISGAKITITEPRPGAAETVIIISGTPEQTHAAQSLLQAFVLCGSDSS